jgi:hypothetical protein
MSRPRRFLFLSLAAVMIGLCVISCVIFAWTTCFGGPPAVTVTVTNFRPGAFYFCVVCDDEGQLCAMHWDIKYITRIDVPPSTDGYRDPSWPSNQPIVRNVRWRTGTRYGVVQRSVDKQWTVTWFEAGDVPGIEERSVTFDLSRGRTEPLPDGALPGLELSDVPDHIAVRP